MRRVSLEGGRVGRVLVLEGGIACSLLEAFVSFML